MAAALDKKALFEEMPIPRAIASLAVPMIIGQLVVLAYNLADTFFIGRTNDPLMVAGASLILPYYNITLAFSGLAGNGGGSLISRLLGAHDEASARKVSSFSLGLALLIAAIFSLGTALFMDPLLFALGASIDTFVYAKQYAFCVIVIGAIPTVLAVTSANLLRSVGCARQAGFGISMGGIINIALDPLFMFVLFPRGMETAAAGAATATSNVIVCAYAAAVMRRMKDHSVLRISTREGLPSRADIASIFWVGVPAAISTLLFDIACMLICGLAASYGDIPLAAIGIVLKAERVPLNVGIGLCQGMMPLAAYNFASGDTERMRRAVAFTRNVGICFALVSVAAYIAFAPQIIRAFINDSPTIEVGTKFLRVRAVATPLMFFCFHLVFFFQAVGIGRTALALAVIRWGLFNIPCLLAMEAAFGMFGIVWTQLVSDIFTVAASAAIYIRFVRSLPSRSI